MFGLFLSIICLFFLNDLSVVSQDPIGLRVSASLRGLSMGTAIRVEHIRANIDQGNYTSTILKNYQMVVAESEMKPDVIWLGDNVYNFTDADWLLGATPSSTGWVQQNGLQIRGHNLLWVFDGNVPRWLLKNESSITSDKAKSLLSDYIHTVVGRYRGKIACWDVVNEPIDDSKNNSHPFNVRNDFWYRKLGIDYIRYAFTFAREADPDAKLYLNEYSVEATGRKADRVFELVSWLQSQKIPIDGVGIEWHTGVGNNLSPGDHSYQNAERFVNISLDVMATETDVPMPVKGGVPVNPAHLQKQGQVYRALVKYMLHFAPNAPAMVTWGFTDRYSWIGHHTRDTQGLALPFDENYQPKPAYWQMQEELARVIPDGVYRLSPQSQPNTCLGASPNTTLSTVQLYTDACNNTNEKWNITWLADGTYRISPLNVLTRTLAAYNTTSKIGEVQLSPWSADHSEEWVFVINADQSLRIGPRNAWIRVLSATTKTNVGIVDHSSGTANQNWILMTV